MRRAFTLIEILVIVAIMAAMTTAAVVSIRTGQQNARIKGSVRDAFAAIHLARSMALVSKQPSVITYSTVKDDDETCARIEVHTAKPFSTSSATVVETIDGETISVDGDGEAESKQKKKTAKDDAAEPLMKEGEGQSTEDFLFAPADDEIFRGIALKVVKEGDELAEFEEQRAKPKISVFSNVDFLLGKFNESRAKSEQAAKQDSETAAGSGDSPASTADEHQEAVSFVWEVNGRVEPHKVWFYKSGTRYDEGLCISVDRFGAVKVLSPEDER